MSERARRQRWSTIGLSVALAIGGLVALTAGPPHRAGASDAVVAADADAAVSCTIVVPDDPLTAQSLATPYRLDSGDGQRDSGGGQDCSEADPDTSAFVQATIFDPATGRLSVYNPLVVTGDDDPAAAPVVPTLPADAVVGIWFGFNGDNLTLQGGANGNCVNGPDGSIFGQFAYCNAPEFFASAGPAVTDGQVKVPALGTGQDGEPCMTVRDFGIVDQDQSDNVTATYLITQGGEIAQDTPDNLAALPGATVLSNGSDNGLLVNFVAPALGCSSFTAPDIVTGVPQTALALDELAASVQQTAPVAYVPPNDPMVLDGDNQSLTKTNLYRVGVGQPTATSMRGLDRAYCSDMTSVGTARLMADQNLFTGRTSPDPAMAVDLYTFMGVRLMGSFDNLGCGDLLGIPNLIASATNDDGVATAITVVAPGNNPDPSAGR
jgi:hypothetical protein